MANRKISEEVSSGAVVDTDDLENPTYGPIYREGLTNDQGAIKFGPLAFFQSSVENNPEGIDQQFVTWDPLERKVQFGNTAAHFDAWIAGLINSPEKASEMFALLLASHINEHGGLVGNDITLADVTLTEVQEDPTLSPLVFYDSDILEDVLPSTFTISAMAFTPDETAPPEHVVVELGTNSHTIEGYAFDSNSEEILYLYFRPPAWVDPTTFTVSINFTNATTATSGVVWGVSARAYDAGDALDQAMGTEVEVSHTTASGTYPEQITVESAAITPAGTWAEGDGILLKLVRDPSAGGDTLAQDAIFKELSITFEVADLTGGL